MEILLPPPTLAYLGVSPRSCSAVSHSLIIIFEQRVQSISATVVSFLTAISVMNEGVREIVPFVRIISQYIDFEWKVVKAQDHGKGVICASTW